MNTKPNASPSISIITSHIQWKLDKAEFTVKLNPAFNQKRIKLNPEVRKILANIKPINNGVPLKKHVVMLI